MWCLTSFRNSPVSHSGRLARFRTSALRIGISLRNMDYPNLCGNIYDPCQSSDESSRSPTPRLPVTVAISYGRCLGSIAPALSSVAEQTHPPVEELLANDRRLGGHAVNRMDNCLAFQYKAPFGEGGLSAQLRSMEFADLRNYLLLKQSENLRSLWLLALWPWSPLKFSTRLLIAAFPTLPSRQKTV